MISGPTAFEKSPTKNDVQSEINYCEIIIFRTPTTLGGPTCFILPSLRLLILQLFYLIVAIASMLSGGPDGAAPHERRQARQTRREAACKHLNREFSSILSV